MYIHRILLVFLNFSPQFFLVRNQYVGNSVFSIRTGAALFRDYLHTSVFKSVFDNCGLVCTFTGIFKNSQMVVESKRKADDSALVPAAKKSKNELAIANKNKSVLQAVREHNLNL